MQNKDRTRKAEPSTSDEKNLLGEPGQWRCAVKRKALASCENIVQEKKRCSSPVNGVRWQGIKPDRPVWLDAWVDRGRKVRKYSLAVLISRR